MLTRAGAAVETAENGQVALTLTGRQSFDAVLMDIQMPVMDGYTAIRELRARGSTVPIIALTAHAMAGEDRRCRFAGCDGYLTKPVSREDLLQTLSRICDMRPPDETPADGPPPIAIEGGGPLHSTLDPDDAELQEIVEEFTTTVSSQVDEIDAAWSRREWNALGVGAHAVKGTAAMTGFPELAKVAADLEDAAANRESDRIPKLLTTIESLVERMTAPDVSAEAAGAHIDP
jgi:CheY-like chemotaxis protein